MHRVSVWAAVLLLCSGVADPVSAAPAAAIKAESLPAVGADRVMEPLRADQLDPEERASFARLAPGSPEARKFLYTRGFLRYCRLVVSGQLPPTDLPRLPVRDNWDRQYLSQAERDNILDVALAMNLRLRLAGMTPSRPDLASQLPDPDDRLADVDAEGMIAPLRVDQLDPAERSTFASLAPGSPEARKFLYTRSFLRFCRLVIDGKLAPLGLPKLPLRENWDRQFLSQAEQKEVVDVAIGMKLTARLNGTTP